MNEVITATLVGGIVGLIFGLIDLPIPAPPALSGVMGIVGIFGGLQARYLSHGELGADHRPPAGIDQHSRGQILKMDVGTVG